MSGSFRKLCVIGVAVGALVVAGSAGALVRSMIFTIQYQHYARLSGTKVFCANSINSHKQRAFLCSVLLPRGVPRTYLVAVGQPGMEVGRWSATGSTLSTLRKFANP
jgi:hypothetical protein